MRRGPRKRSHEWIDRRSLALARAIARKIRKDPSLIDTARKTLARWRRRRGVPSRALEEWDGILAGSSVDRIVSALLDDSEEGRRRRQSSPFTGILSPRERDAIFKHYEEIGA